MRVLVTGANGFLGRHLVPALAANGFEPVGLALEANGLPENLPCLAVDICDLAALTRAVDEVAPDAIVHLAALSHVGESWRRIADYHAVNVVGTENVVTAARGRRLLFSSSAEIYGQVPESEQPIGEARAAAPRSPYALTKAVGERVALAAGAVVIRSFNLVGPGQTANFALPSFAAQLAVIARGQREPVLRVGNLHARRDFVPVVDAVSAFRLLLGRGEAGIVYNLASGVPRSIAEMLALLLAVTGVEARTELDPDLVRPVDIALLVGDAARLRALGWQPGHGLEAALSELWRAARAEAA